MSRLIPVFLLMIFSYSAISVNTATAGTEDDLQTAYTIEDANWFIAHHVVFKVASPHDWIKRDQNLLKYAYRMNLNPTQLKEDARYTNMTIDSLESRDSIVKKSAPMLRKHNADYAEQMERKLIAAYRQGNPNHIKLADDPFLGQIALHKNHWMSNQATHDALQRYGNLLRNEHWNIESCRQLETEFATMRKQILFRFKYFLWEKKHDLFIHKDDALMRQIVALKAIQKRLNQFTTTLQKSDIDNPQYYIELAVLHEAEWHQCRHILDIAIPTKHKQLISTLTNIEHEVFSSRIMGKLKKIETTAASKDREVYRSLPYDLSYKVNALFKQVDEFNKIRETILNPKEKKTLTEGLT